MPRLVARSFPRWFFAAAIAAGWLVGRPATAQVPEPAGPPVEAAGEATPTEDAAAEEETPAEAAGGAPQWMQDIQKRLDPIDAAFGKYLVAPLASVLFFDFGTSKSEVIGTSIPFVVVWLFAGAVFFTVRMGFINFRAFRHAIDVVRGKFDDPDDAGEVSHFQALSSALSATVGLGNIAGVAIAVAGGGPGAVFWMIIAGLLGMSSKFSECTLGLMYRKKLPDGTVTGGPMHYLKDGLAELGMGSFGAVLAAIFTVLCIGASFGGGCSFQVVQSLGALQEEAPFFNDAPYVYGVIMAILVGVVILGGIRRIAATAEKIVPFMCGLYLLIALYVLAVNFAKVPTAIGLIFEQAFTANALYGGTLGVMVMGIRRAAFSNEAGVGSASIAHSAAKTDEPISEGVVALLEPFIDTVIVCTITGLVITITGAYDNPDPEYQALRDASNGAALTSRALGEVNPLFPKVLVLIVVMFAFSTLISWSYYGERCTTHLFGPRASLPYKLLFLVFVFLGSIVKPLNILDFSDLMILSMAVPNILGVALLSGKIRERLDDYMRRLRSGELAPVKK